MNTSNIFDQLQNGFRLEKPDLALPWNTPLNHLASISGGEWYNDRYFWPSAIFLGGLEFTLMSDAGILIDAPFTEITALVGLDTKTGLWSDELSINGFNQVGQHLSTLLGIPDRQFIGEPIDDRYMFWERGKINIYLSIIEMHCYRCNLSIYYSEP